MKIGFFTDGYLPTPNGVATSVAASAKALEKRGHEVYIVAPKQPGHKDARNVFRLTSVKMYGGMDERLALTLPEKTLREVLKIDFDIIHGHAGGPVTFLGWQIARLKGVPFVGTYHTLWNRYTHYILQGKLVSPRMAEVATRIFGNLTDYLIAPTPRVKKELISYGVKKPIEVVPSGLDLSKFEKSQKGFLRKRLGLKQQDKVLLYVGRLGKEKSVDFIIRSFAKIQPEFPDAHLVLIGDGTIRAKLEKLAKRLKLQENVHFAGFIDQADIQKVYVDADIFVFASQTETQGMVIIEAFASGLPVVAIKDPAFEGVVEDGKNGFLVKRGTSEFASKALSLLNNEDTRRKFSKVGKETAKKHSVEITAERLEEIYKKLIKTHKVGRFRQRIKDLRQFIDLTNRVNKLKNAFVSYF